ncbi:hypothetical protein B0T20DRAFT_226035 [Sordaria brevicollis]|uniref:Uncharacterized protein n=1 Tax=Sordaria brevicollis TaxID=83679 RepID=A0AAE0PCX7_SORBR|nr:hypothetical protein B0T20DRAFT_226035 [Sordaria brevicollis]
METEMGRVIFFWGGNFNGGLMFTKPGNPLGALGLFDFCWGVCFVFLSLSLSLSDTHNCNYFERTAWYEQALFTLLLELFGSVFFSRAVSYLHPDFGTALLFLLVVIS